MGLVKTVGIQKLLMDITNSLKRDFTSSNFVCYHFPWFEWEWDEMCYPARLKEPKYDKTTLTLDNREAPGPTIKEGF